MIEEIETDIARAWEAERLGGSLFDLAVCHHRPDERHFQRCSESTHCDSMSESYVVYGVRWKCPADGIVSTPTYVVHVSREDVSHARSIGCTQSKSGQGDTGRSLLFKYPASWLRIRKYPFSTYRSTDILRNILSASQGIGKF